ncbi:MAG: hypothetical protein IPN69_16640 [Acidobacteria bacterium]|nr:hypothetical protein [Acidobacteriota bacterium]
MTEKTKTEELEESLEGSYYYDDATGYELFDPDAPDDAVDEDEESDEVRLTQGQSRAASRTTPIP